MKVLSVLMGVMTAAVFAATEVKEFDSSGITEVEIESMSGKVSVLPLTGEGKAKVEVTKHKFSDKCQLTMEKRGKKLDIHLKKSGVFGREEECQVDFTVTVPKRIDLDVELGMGKVAVQGTQGELDFKVGSGSFTAEGSFNDIDGKAGHGDVEIKGLTGSGDIKTGNGNISLTFTQLPSEGEIELKTGNGNATLYFPKGSKLKTDYVVGRGDMTNELGSTPDAKFKVKMRSGLGNLAIKTL